MRCENVVINEYLGQMVTDKDKSFESLYIYTEELVYSYALSIVKNRHLAEDIKHDTFIKIYKNIDRYDDDKNGLAWIIKIVKNTALNALKQQQRLAKPFSFYGESDENGIESNEINSLKGEDDFSDIEEKGLINFILKNLSEKYSQIIILHLLNGYTHKETAQMLELPLTTVQWRYREAIRKLKQFYKKGGGI